jgi:peptidyl-prolyl cis-trans isomerase SurA
MTALACRHVSHPLGVAVGLAAALLACPAGAAGQTMIVDRIVAIVGTKPILQSQVEERLVELQAQGQPLPTDSAGRALARRQLLVQMIQDEILILQADRDTTVHVTDQEVEDQVEQTVQNVRRNYPNDSILRAQLNLAGFASVEEWRRRLSEEQRRQILRQRLIQGLQQKGKLKPINPTEAQMRAFWEERRASQPKRPATVSFRQIVVLPRPDSVARARAQQTAESLLVAVRAGADFAAAAKRFSDDSGSREQGGELGWFRRGVMVKPFETAAFQMKPGQISDPVESDFGFHIIQVERVQPAEILARHILISPQITPAQIDKAHQLADSIRAALARGSSYDSLARLYTDENEPKLAEAVTADSLPAAYRQILSRDTTLGLKPVLPIGGGRHTKFAVVDVTRRQPEGELAFDEVKDQIRNILSQNLMIQHYVDQLRRLTYVDVRL